MAARRGGLLSIDSPAGGGDCSCAATYAARRARVGSTSVASLASDATIQLANPVKPQAAA